MSQHKAELSMRISHYFKNFTALGSRRVSFQFSVSGTVQSGISYVTRNVPEGADLMIEAEKACRVLCKRAGADTATLHAIVGPVR